MSLFVFYDGRHNRPVLLKTPLLLDMSVGLAIPENWCLDLKRVKESKLLNLCQSIKYVMQLLES